MAAIVLTKTLTGGTDGLNSAPADVPADCWVYVTAATTFFPNGVTGGGFPLPATTWTNVGRVEDLSATRFIGTVSQTLYLWGDYA